MEQLQCRPHQDISLALSPVQGVNRALIKLFDDLAQIEPSAISMLLRMSIPEIEAFRQLLAKPRLRGAIADARVPVIAFDFDPASLRELITNAVGLSVSRSDRLIGRKEVHSAIVRFNEAALLHASRTCTPTYLGILCLGLSPIQASVISQADPTVLLAYADLPICVAKPRLSLALMRTLLDLETEIDDKLLSLILGCVASSHETLHLDRTNEFALPSKRLKEVIACNWNLTRMLLEIGVEGDHSDVHVALLGLPQVRTKVTVLRRAHAMPVQVCDTSKYWVNDLAQAMSITAIALSIARLHRTGMSFAESVLFAYQHHRACVMPGPVSREEFRLGDVVRSVAQPMTQSALDYTFDQRAGLMLVSLTSTHYGCRKRGHRSWGFLTGLGSYLQSPVVLRKALEDSTVHSLRDCPSSRLISRSELPAKSEKLVSHRAGPSQLDLDAA